MVDAVEKYGRGLHLSVMHFLMMHDVLILFFLLSEQFARQTRVKRTVAACTFL
jgi:hypothetical protein